MTFGLAHRPDVPVRTRCVLRGGMTPVFTRLELLIRPN
jgi:hypothetical protein